MEGPLVGALGKVPVAAHGIGQADLTRVHIWERKEGRKRETKATTQEEQDQGPEGKSRKPFHLNECQVVRHTSPNPPTGSPGCQLK